MKEKVKEALSHIRFTANSVVANPSYIISALKYAGMKDSDRLWETVGYNVSKVPSKALTRRFFNAVDMGSETVVQEYLKQIKQTKTILDK